MTKIIAELGINANGDINLAKRLIDVAYSAGCDYVKFQKRDIYSVYSEEELEKPRKSPWGTTTREQKDGLEFTLADYHTLNIYCRDKIGWFASPWDVMSLDFLSRFHMPYIKVASAMLTDVTFLKMCRAAERPIILSTGMSDLDMVDRAIEILGKKNVRCIMHCTSTYPTATDEMNLSCITVMKQRYPWTKIGFSNHHPGIVFMAAAAALGAEMIEFHITLDKLSYGSDQAASISPEGVYKVVKYIRDVRKAMGDGYKKIYDSELPIIDKLRRA